MTSGTVPPRRGRRRPPIWVLILAVAVPLVLGSHCHPRDLSPAQRQTVRELAGRLLLGELTVGEYRTLVGQIQPLDEVLAGFAELDEERRSLNDVIATQGYDGHEDCVPPPSETLISEIVARTPVDPPERERLRAALPAQDDSARVMVDDFLHSRGSPPELAAVFVHSDVDPWGRYHARFRQTHQGVPLTKGSVVVHEMPSGGQAVSDFTLDGIALDVVPTVESAQAGAFAVAAVDPSGARGYVATPVLMVDPTLENVLVDASDPENGASYEWQVRGAQLVWQVVVAPDYTDFNTAFDAILAGSPVTFDEAGDPADRDDNTLLGGREDEPRSDDAPFVYPTATPFLVTVNALSGEIVEMEPLLEEDLDDFMQPPTVGLGIGYYNSLVDLNTTFWPPFNAYVLADFTRSKPGTANIVLHGNNLDTHDVADFDLMLDDNNVWGNGLINFEDPACLTCTTGQTPAVDVAFGMQRTYDFFSNVLGRWGIDDAGLSQTAVAHWDIEYNDAHFNGASGLIAFGNGKDASDPGNYSLGTVAHEIGHAVWSQEEVGTSGNPAKAMNEGHGDMLGGLVDIYQDTTDGQGDWLYRIPWAGGKWRSRTLDPAGYEECVTSNDIEMCETGRRYWDFFVEISTFEHVGGIPFTRAFMHMAEGSSTDVSSPYYTKFFPDEPMRGIGLNKAAAIWIHMVNHFLPASPNLAEARFAAWQAAEDLFGANSTEAKATANAFAAVGMGAKPADTAPPSIPVAKVHTLNLRTLTARTYGVVDDDTGAEMVEPPGMARKNDAFLGYLDLSELPVGVSPVHFRAVDSEGNEATATRLCRLHYRPQLLEDGGFEESSGSAWSAADKGEDEGGALFGEKYLRVGTTPTRQLVDLTTVKGPELSYWVGANKGLRLFDQMQVRVLDTDLNPLALLATHDLGDDWFPRPARSNGYVNVRHDLSAWEGQEVVIHFGATRNGVFRVDHAVVSFASVLLLPPTIEMFETDNSVFLTVTDTDFAPFEAMDLSPRIYVDGAEAGPLVTQISVDKKYIVHLAIDALGPGAHFTHTVAVNGDDDFVAAGNAEWFAPKPVNELLSNGRFEAGLAGWVTAGLGVAVEDADDGFVYQGDHAVRLGGVGAVNAATIRQNVVVPPNVKSLKFTARVRREFADANNDVEDMLVVDFLDQANGVLDSAVLYDTGDVRLDHEPPHNFKTHFLVSYSPSAAALSGKTVRVRIRTLEDDEGASAFVVDNASLTYTDWGLQLGG